MDVRIDAMIVETRRFLEGDYRIRLLSETVRTRCRSFRAPEIGQALPLDFDGSILPDQLSAASRCQCIIENDIDVLCDESD